MRSIVLSKSKPWNIRWWLAQEHAGDDEAFTLVLANPPFAGSLDYENTAKDLLQIVKTKKTELLFLALFLRLLKPGGRAAVIVPDGVLFGSSKAHKELRRMLVEEQKLDAVVSLPGGVFKPYAGVSTAILLFTKTNSGGTDFVWFYDVDADGWSLDDKRTPRLAEDTCLSCPDRILTATTWPISSYRQAWSRSPIRVRLGQTFPVSVLAPWRRREYLSHPCPSSGGLRRYWTVRRHCGPSAAPPSRSSTR